MPVLRDLCDFDSTWMRDTDSIPRPIVTLGADGIVLTNPSDEAASDLDAGQFEFHSHQKSQLVLSLRGVLTIEVERSLWLIPPQNAIWVPAGVPHKIECAGTMECYVTYIDRTSSVALPSTCCMLTATPLLKELIIRSAQMPVLYDEGGIESHLATLLLDEIAIAPTGNLHLPMPIDFRLRKIVDAIMRAPSERGTMQTWAQRIGMSERSLARHLERETGMSFGRWRQQVHLMLAVKWLEGGSSVQEVADSLGYESAGSFITMFRKVLGSSPARYIAERRIDR